MNSPLQDFEQLRQYLILLRQGEIDLKVGRKSLTALIAMVDEPDTVALCNIVELAEKTGISPASITRLAKLLGFSGFNPFQQLFKQRAKVPGDYYSTRVKYLVDCEISDPTQVIQQQLQSSVANIEYCLKRLNLQDLERATQLLARTKRVFVFGHMQSSAVASVLRYGLCLIRRNVHFLAQAEQGVAIALGQLRKNDLLVIFSSSPYSNLSVKLASMAKKQGCQLLAITDSTLSPLDDHANCSIHVPTEGQYYTNSLAANCIFIESLLSLTAMELGQRAVERLNQHEVLVADLNINA